MRLAADELRAGAGRRHRHVRRQPQHQRLQHLHRRLRVLRLRAIAPLAGRLRALRGGVRAARRRGGRVRGDGDLHPVRHPPRLAARGLRAVAAARQAARAPAPPARVLADGGLAHVRRQRPGSRGRCSSGCARPGLDSTPGTAAEVLHDGVRERISPNKLPVARWVEIIEASHAERDPLDGDGDVRAHRGAVGAGRAHARRPRAPGADRRVHRVRAAVVHPVPHAARPHARDRGDLPRGEPQAHGRVPARARQDDHEPAGELGEDGARRGHRVAALGRQRPRRHADGGVDQPDGRQLPRRQARARRPDRAPRTAPGVPRPSARRCTRSGGRYDATAVAA